MPRRPGPRLSAAATVKVLKVRGGGHQWPAYAAQQPGAADERARTEHARFFGRLAESEHKRLITGDDQPAAIRRLRAEQENVFIALYKAINSLESNIVNQISRTLANCL
jgi:hypothetical protein